MAYPKLIPKVRLIIGIMYKHQEHCDKVISTLKERFGDIQDSVEYNFDFTDYYEQETGDRLKKILIIFRNPVSRETLPEIKLWTNDIEDSFRESGKRKVNIDPGYMTAHNVVLASLKEMPHRILLAKGVFGDVVLEYKDNEFHHSIHTFPDYKTELVKEFLKKHRPVPPKIL